MSGKLRNRSLCYLFWKGYDDNHSKSENEDREGVGVCDVFHALLWKQWVRRKRLFLLLLFEIFMPIFIAGLVAQIRLSNPAFVFVTAPPRQVASLQEETGEAVVEDGWQSVPYLSPLRKRWAVSDDKIGQKSRRRSSRQSREQEEPFKWKMAYGPITDTILAMKKKSPSSLPEENVKLVNSEREMEDLLQEAYRRRDTSYLGGVFLYDDTMNEDTEANITTVYRLFHQLSSRLVDQYWHLPPQQIVDEIVPLFRNRFHFLQWIPILDYSKHCHSKCQEADVDFYVKPSFFTIPFARTPIRTLEDGRLLHISYLFHLFPFAFLGSWVALVYSVLKERACGVADSERASGATLLIQTFAWAIGAMVPLAVSICAATWLLTADFSGGNGAALDLTAPSIIFFALLLFVASNMAFCAMMLPLFNHAFMGAIVTVVVWVCAGVLSAGVLRPNYLTMSIWTKAFLSLIHPHCSFMFTLQVIALYYVSGNELRWQEASSGAHLHLQDRPGQKDNWTIFCCFAATSMSTLLYLLLAAAFWCARHMSQRWRQQNELEFAAATGDEGAGMCGLELPLGRRDEDEGRTAKMALEPGEVCALWGPAGQSGKSAVCRTVAGLGRELGRLLGGHGKVGLAMGHHCFHEHFTVRDNLVLFAKLRGCKRPVMSARAMEEDLSLLHVGRCPGGQLPPWLRARLVLGVAMVGRPSLVVLDEPWSWPHYRFRLLEGVEMQEGRQPYHLQEGVGEGQQEDHHAERQRSQLRDLLRTVARKRRVPVLLSCSHGEEAVQMGWNVLAMRKRELWAWGSANQVLDTVESGYVVELAGEGAREALLEYLPWAKPASLIDDDDEDIFDEGGDAVVVPRARTKDLIQIMPQLEKKGRVRLRFVGPDEALRRGIRGLRDILSEEEDPSRWHVPRRPRGVGLGLGGSTSVSTALVHKSALQVWRRPWRLAAHLLALALLLSLGAPLLSWATDAHPGWKWQAGRPTAKSAPGPCQMRGADVAVETQSPWHEPAVAVTLKEYQQPTFLFKAGDGVPQQVVDAILHLLKDQDVRTVLPGEKMAHELRYLSRKNPEWYRKHCLGAIDLEFLKDAGGYDYMHANIYFNPYYPLTATLEMDLLANAQNKVLLLEKNHHVLTVYHPLPRIDKLETAFLQSAPYSRLWTCCVLAAAIFTLALAQWVSCLTYPVMMQAQNNALYVQRLSPKASPFLLASTDLIGQLPLILIASLSIAIVVSGMLHLVFTSYLLFGVFLLSMMCIATSILLSWCYALLLGGSSNTLLLLVNLASGCLAPLVMHSLRQKLMPFIFLLLRMLLFPFPAFAAGEGLLKLLLLALLNTKCDLLSHTLGEQACRVLQPPPNLKINRTFIENTNYRCCDWSCANGPCTTTVPLLTWFADMSQVREIDIGSWNSLWWDQRQPSQDDLDNDLDLEDSVINTVRESGANDTLSTEESRMSEPRRSQQSSPGVLQSLTLLIVQAMAMSFFLLWKGRVGWKRRLRHGTSPKNRKEAEEEEAEWLPWGGQASVWRERQRVKQLVESGLVEEGTEWALVLRQVRGMSLAVRKGECVAVVGDPYGTKTIAQIISGQKKALGIWVDGIGHGWPTRVGFSPAKGGVSLELTGGEALWLAGMLRGLGEKESKVQGKRWAQVLGMGPGLLRCRVDQLPVSSRKLLSFALAMIGQPPLVLLHKPLTGLEDSYRGRTALRRAIREIKKEGKSAVILVGSGEGLGWGALQAICERMALLGPGGRLQSITGNAQYRPWAQPKETQSGSIRSVLASPRRRRSRLGAYSSINSFLPGDETRINKSSIFDITARESRSQESAKEGSPKALPKLSPSGYKASPTGSIMKSTSVSSISGSKEEQSTQRNRAVSLKDSKVRFSPESSTLRNTRKSLSEVTAKEPPQSTLDTMVKQQQPFRHAIPSLLEVHLYLEAVVVESRPWEVKKLKEEVLKVLGRPLQVKEHHALHMVYFLPSPPISLSQTMARTQELCKSFPILKNFHVEHSSSLIAMLIARHSL